MSTNIISRVRAKKKQVFYGWWVVAAGFIINAFGVGTFFYGFSTFFKPLESLSEGLHLWISGFRG